MTVTASLLVYASLLAVVGQVGLRRLTVAGVAPRLGIIAWQLAAVSVIGSWALGVLALAGPVPLHDLSHLIASRLTAVDQLVEVPGVGWLHVGSVAVATAIVARAGWCVVVDGWAAYRRRAEHAEAVALVGRPLAGRQALIVDHEVAMVYCLPGRARQVVVTRGAVQSLTDVQLSAVLAHEAAHLRGRHHLALAPLRALARAFPAVPLLSAAAREVGRLLEMCADDAAARRYGPAAVAGALRALSPAPPPAGALGASGGTAEERIARLQRRPAGRRTHGYGSLSAAIVLLVTGPAVAVTVPLLMAAMRSGYCPVPI